MIVTVAAHKGGVGKTTTAVHVAAYLHGLNANEPACLLDNDVTRNATDWYKRGLANDDPALRFPFPVARFEQATKLAPLYRHFVIDTGQRPGAKDLEDLASGCDLMIVPTVPSSLDTDGLLQTIQALQGFGVTNYKVLLTRVPPDAAKQVAEIRAALSAVKVPVFATEIPRLKAYQTAAEMGVVVSAAVDRVQGARAWSAYAAVGAEILACAASGAESCADGGGAKA